MFPLNRGWLYADNATPASTDPAFDDSGCERVTVPHANRTFPWHSFDDRDYQFVSVYRRHFTPPEGLKDRRVFVDFEGVMDILKRELKCNVVRTSHYPQSVDFLNRCDEIGLLVFEEMPAWQHICDEGWKDLACRDVGVMVKRDRNHPSIILWGVRVNESQDDHGFYARTNAIVHALDDSRQTGASATSSRRRASRTFSV